MWNVWWRAEVRMEFWRRYLKVGKPWSRWEDNNKMNLQEI